MENCISKSVARVCLDTPNEQSIRTAKRSASHYIPHTLHLPASASRYALQTRTPRAPVKPITELHIRRPELYYTNIHPQSSRYSLLLGRYTCSLAQGRRRSTAKDRGWGANKLLREALEPHCFGDIVRLAHRHSVLQGKLSEEVSAGMGRGGCELQGKYSARKRTECQAQRNIEGK
ncbi:hypothetical protein BDV96DRAFT_115654 [Lophiotrema nucula]|uniref:Uncharacterized protein n=1 Tax=Lophiotrema nucula TaxID=690887 RepID=A0A6A5Z2L3_9PLEO|nr:hypothetical protein BDV96DRAFT_115654 [Lophiotrema nucula]